MYNLHLQHPVTPKPPTRPRHRATQTSKATPPPQLRATTPTRRGEQQSRLRAPRVRHRKLTPRPGRGRAPTEWWVLDQVDGGERGGEGQGGQARPGRRAGLRAVRRRHLHHLLRARLPRLREEHRQEPCGQSQGSARDCDNVTRPFRVAGAAAPAPVIDKGLKGMQEKLNLPTQMYAFALVVGSVAAVCLTIVGILILSK